jgi:hypothetical protein
MAGDKMDFRKANANDIHYLILYRKQQLIDEGLSPNANMDIDKELSDYLYQVYRMAL